MPIYEYECGQCGSRFEKRQGFDAEPMATCPRCKGKSRRIIHPTSIVFKGSGFHITDHRKTKEPAAELSKPGKTKEPAAEASKPEKAKAPAVEASKPEKAKGEK